MTAADYPTHRALSSTVNGKITSVMDCFSGRTLRVLHRHHAVGEIVKTGGITTSRSSKTLCVDHKFWVVIGHCTWHAARSMANRTPLIGASLHPGVWHEVISE